MKLLKKLLFLGAVLCLVLGIAACTDNGDPGPDDKTVTYTVSVTCEDALTLETIKVKMMSGTTEVAKKAVEKNGEAYQAVFSLAPADYVAELEGMLENFTYTPATLTPITTSATVALQKKGAETDPSTPAEKIDYSVTVKLPNGDPVGNIDVQLCGGPIYTCTQSTTDENGVAAFKLAAGNYEVHIEAKFWPDGYLFDDKEFTIGSTGGNVDVTFHEAQTYTVNVYWVSYEKDQWGWKTAIKGDVIPDAQIALYKQWYDEDYVQHVDETPSAKGVTDENGTVELIAPKGVFVVRIVDCPASWSYQTTLVVEESAPELDLKVLLRGSDEDNRYEVTEGTHTVSIGAGKGNAGIWYGFTPQTGKSGYYTVTSDAKGVEVDAYLYAGTSTYVNTATPTSSDNERGDFSIEFRITAAECAEDNHNVWVFKFVALTDEACSFEVTFAWEKEYVEPTDVRTRPHAQETKAEATWSQYVSPADTTWTWLTYLDADSIVKGDDGFYHVGENGPVVFAAVGNGMVAPNFDTTFPAALMEAGENAVTWSDGTVDKDNKTYTYNLTDFFADYAEASNEEGLHPLTEELKLALQHYAITSGIYNWRNWPSESDGLYTFLCGYYKSNYESTTGAGTADSPFNLTGFGDYKVTLTAGGEVFYHTRVAGTVTFKEAGVTLKFDGKTYTSAEPVAITSADYSGATFSFTASEAKTFVFTFADELGSEQNPYVFREGANTVDVPQEKIYDGLFYTFTVSTTGLYTFTTTGACAFVADPSYILPELAGESSFTFEFIGGKTYLFNCGVALDEEPAAYTVNIAKAAPATASGSGTESVPYEIGEEGWYRVSVTDSTPAQFFSFNARTEGHWQIVCYNPVASILDFNDVAHTLGEIEISFAIDIKAKLPALGLFTFSMGSNSDTGAVYFFLFRQVEDSGEGGGDVEGGLVLGTNTIEYGEWGCSDTFVATEAGTYTFSIESENANVAIEIREGETETILDGSDPQMKTYTKELSKGESIKFVFVTNNWQADTFTFTITKA